MTTPRFRDLLTAEWVKFWSLRSTAGGLVLTALLVIGSAVQQALYDRDNFSRWIALALAATGRPTDATRCARQRPFTPSHTAKAVHTHRALAAHAKAAAMGTRTRLRFDADEQTRAARVDRRDRRVAQPAR